MRFGTHPDKIRLVIDINDITDFRAFTLSDPHRLVIDLPRFSWQAAVTQTPSQTLVLDIRQGQLSAGISRIVFDLKAPAIIKSAFLLPTGKGQQNARLVVDYKIVDYATFAGQKGNIHGTLKIDKYTIAPQASNNTKLYASTTNAHIPRPPPNTLRPNEETILKKPIIIIDPGHGGIDPGAVSYNNIYEKDIVLNIAKELKKQLQATNRYQIYMTRESDVFVKLQDRVKFARKHNGDLFISIHADSIRRSDVRGTSIYTLSKKSSDAQTAALARRENQADLIAGIELNIEDDQVAFILGDFLMNETMNQSKFLANTLVDTMHSQKIKTLHNPHRYAGFAVLKAPDIPSVLVETGFMSNKSEVRLLTQKQHQQKIATAIHKGINAYFTRIALNENN
ncbi:MAG: N-acetylmuramoyl-L-alanine amidase [Alphaproteobacteria bacterium]